MLDARIYFPFCKKDEKTQCRMMEKDLPSSDMQTLLH